MALESDGGLGFGLSRDPGIGPLRVVDAVDSRGEKVKYFLERVKKKRDPILQGVREEGDSIKGISFRVGKNEEPRDVARRILFDMSEAPDDYVLREVLDNDELGEEVLLHYESDFLIG